MKQIPKYPITVITSLCLSLLTGTQRGFAEYTLDSAQVIEVVISKSGFTRISVDGEIIKNVFCYPMNVEEHVHLNQSGHVFVVGEGLKSPLHLSLITDRGVTQDLKLTVASQKPHPVIFKKAEAPKTDNTPQLLASFVQGIYPEGFSFTPLNTEERKVGDFKVTAAGSWVKEDIRIVLYELENLSEENIPITAEQVRGPHDQAIVLMGDHVPAQGKVRYFVKQSLNRI